MLVKIANVLHYSTYQVLGVHVQVSKEKVQTSLPLQVCLI